jgi:spermidine synthase
MIMNFLYRAKNHDIHSLFNSVSSEPYATHLPVLLAVSIISGAKKVLELGSGRVSTAFWASDHDGVSVAVVDSLEDDAAWAAIVSEMIPKVSRVRLRAVNDINETLKDLDITAYDIIFIDNATTVATRAQTINEIQARAAATSIIIVHDYENNEYRRMVPDGWAVTVFRHVRPYTGVICPPGVSQQKIAQINDAVKYVKSKIAPSGTLDLKTLASELAQMFGR